MQLRVKLPDMITYKFALPFFYSFRNLPFHFTVLRFTCVCVCVHIYMCCACSYVWVYIKEECLPVSESSGSMPFSPINANWANLIKIQPRPTKGHPRPHKIFHSKLSLLPPGVIFFSQISRRLQAEREEAKHHNSDSRGPTRGKEGRGGGGGMAFGER